MAQYKFQSFDEFIQAVAESKEKHRTRYRTLSYKEKIQQVVRLQKKAYVLGRLKFKPWPVEEKEEK
jgi:hypothetical protein